MSLADEQLACAAALVEGLVAGGLRHACISPGSRSTPIALSLDRHPAVRVWVHLDERSSAFFALGIAKASGEAVAVACTSGTAAAELYPAAVEASQSRTPLVLLTADRPARLVGTGANQTIDQTGLYGRFSRRDFDLAPPRAGDERTWRLSGSVAADAAIGAPAGPVHLNLRFEEPLSPDPAISSTGVGLATSLLQTSDEPMLADLDVDRAVEELSGSAVVVMVGSTPSPPTTLLMLADRMGWPVMAEPASGARRPGFALAAGQPLIANGHWLETHSATTVLQVGAALTTRASQRLTASASRLVVVDDFYLEPDVEGRADLRIHTDIEMLARALIKLPLDPSPAGHAEAWKTADAVARRTVDRLLDGWEEPFEGRVARDLAGHLDGLCVGSSMPIRDLDTFMAPKERFRVIADRGASGIDGFVSMALGAAAAGGPDVALMGDLTFLHDMGALLWNARRAVDATLVVVNNGGGTIFGFLPQRELPEFERLFETPHGVDLGAVALATGAGHTRVERAGDLLVAVDAARSGGGVNVIEVVVDAELDRRRHAEVQAAVDAALGTPA